MTPQPVQIEELYRLVMVGDAQISPDGQQIAYVHKTLDQDTDQYQSNIYVWHDGDTRQYTTSGKDSSPRWSPDGRWLAFLSGRETAAQIYLLATTGGESARLTAQPLGAGPPVWSPDSRAIAFAGPLRLGSEHSPGAADKQPTTRVAERAVYKADGRGFIDDRRTHIWTVDIGSEGNAGETRRLTQGDFNHLTPSWSPDCMCIAFAADRHPEWDLRSQADIWIVPRTGGEPRRITDGHGLWTTPVFAPDGSRLAAIGYVKPENKESTYFPQLWTFSRGGGDARNLLAGIDLAAGNSMTRDWSTAGEDTVFWPPSGIYFLITDRGTANVYRYTDHLESVTAGSQDVMDFSVTGDTLALTLADATRPAEIFRLTIGEGEPVTVTQHNAEMLSTLRLSTPEHITFTGAEGAEIDGWLMKPVGWREGLRYPLIVYIHGGPIAAYGESFFHEFQTLAGQGFGLFFCNPHGSSSRGQHFQVSIMGDWGNLDYQDIMAGVDRVQQEPWVDSQRLGVAGGSYGGFMVNWITGHTDRFAAACTQRSIANMVSQGGTSDWAATRGERLLATPEDEPERLWAMSPLKYARNVRTPTLILHSEQDNRCPIEEGEQWFMALKRQRVPVRFVRFPEESHGLSRGGTPSRRAERLREIVRWFQTYL